MLKVFSVLIEHSGAILTAVIRGVTASRHQLHYLTKRVIVYHYRLSFVLSIVRIPIMIYPCVDHILMFAQNISNLVTCVVLTQRYEQMNRWVGEVKKRQVMFFNSVRGTLDVSNRLLYIRSNYKLFFPPFWCSSSWWRPRRLPKWPTLKAGHACSQSSLYQSLSNKRKQQSQAMLLCRFTDKY